MSSPPIRRTGRGAPYDRRRLRRKRNEAGLSQTALAEITGVSKQQISALECGTNGASPETIAALAEGLGCEVSDLLHRGAA